MNHLNLCYIDFNTGDGPDDLECEQVFSRLSADAVWDYFRTVEFQNKTQKD